MSDLRIFCIGAFIGAGLLAAAGNRDLLNPGDPFVQMISGLLFGGVVAVAFFGRRTS